MSRHYADDKPAFAKRLKAILMATLFRTAHEKSNLDGRASLVRDGYFRPDAIMLSDVRDLRHQLPDLDSLQVLPSSSTRGLPPTEIEATALRTPPL